MILRHAIRAAFVGTVAVASLPTAAHADPAGAVRATVGGAVMGAEAAVVCEALLGIQGNWLYAGGAAVGGGLGAFASARWIDSDSRYTPQLLLGGAFALFLPAMIGLASAQYYRPTDMDRQQTSAAGAKLHAPLLDISPTYTREQTAQLHLQASSDFTVYLLNGVF